MSAAPTRSRTPRSWPDWRSICCGRIRRTARCAGPSIRALVERTRFAAVFTAHPTFALPVAVGQALAEAACGQRARRASPSHRPPPISLADEFAQATAAIANGRDAIDRFNAALLSVARARLAGSLDRPGAAPGDPVELGRLRYRRTHRYRLVGHAAAAAGDEAAAAGTAARPGRRPAGDRGAGSARRRGAGRGGRADRRSVPDAPDPPRVAAFAQALVGRREAALASPEPLMPLFAAAIARADEPMQLALCVARAGLVSHGLALAHTHTRLNAAQIHNVVRQRLGIADPPEDPSHRRALFSAINAALDTVQPVPVDFGALIVEQASAARLMMTVAQIVKHIDGSVPVRFLIAETETGYTLLAALWLARLFGVEQHVEISPLFETAEALEHGATVLEEALRSPHYRAYLQPTGRLALQFGYSDSGRYVGQLAASYLIERLRLKIGRDAGAARRYRRRGGAVRHAWREHRPRRASRLARRPAEIPVAHRVPPGAEPGGAAGARGERIPGRRRLSAVRHAGTRARDDHPHRRADLSSRRRSDRGPGLCRSGFRPPISSRRSAHGMEGLVDDAGYAALLGAFGPALLDRHRLAPGGAAGGRHGGGGAHPPSARAAGDPEQRDPAAARLVREHACRGWARRRRGTPRRSPRCAPTAGASTARWTSRRTRWRIPTSTCCAR